MAILNDNIVIFGGYFEFFMIVMSNEVSVCFSVFLDTEK